MFLQHLLSSVASMLNCSVLRCTNVGFAFVAGNRKSAAGYHEAYVCAGHRALIEAGSPWDMEGHIVLMGQDLAQVLENWSARPSVGSEGFTFTFESASCIKPCEFFLMPAEARALFKFLDAAGYGSDGSDVDSA